MQATAENMKAYVDITESAAAFARKAVPLQEPCFYASPIKVPKCKVGGIEVRHRTYKKGVKLDIVSLRDAVLTGRRPAVAVLKRDTVVHELHEKDHGLWMTDLPCELNQMYEAVLTLKPRGRVLVGGLGLGILPAILAGYQGVDRVVVVELNNEVIKAVRPDSQITSAEATYQYKLADAYDTVWGNVQTFVRTYDGPKFDAVFLDTWQGQSESAFWDQVFPLWRLVRHRFGAVPMWSWKAEEHLSQAYRSLRLGADKHWYHKRLDLPLDHDAAKRFLTTVGLPEWEREFGAAVLP